ncbi:MAG: M48 family metallopeptidase [Candidatus Cloacimonetes bacterium]|nr:M48 family metallopeptidase [Candidatus Cloacimonadota bacterium]
MPYFYKIYPNLGKIKFVPYKSSKRIKISAKPFKGIRISYPITMSFEEAEKALFSKKEILINHMQIVKDYEKGRLKQEKKREMEEINVKEASEFLYKRLIELSEKFNLKFNKITFRNQKTRWGSCSAKNNLSLNIQLILLPNHLQDYVLLHELAHTIVKNHSPKFWAELEKYMPDAKAKRLELRKFPTRKCIMVNV